MPEGETDKRPAGSSWTKTLYGGKQQGYEDNYTDASFLEAMVVNANVVKRDIGTVVRDSVPISQHFCVVAVVAVVWTHALNGGIDSSLLLWVDAIIVLLDFVVLLITNRKGLHPASVLSSLRNLGLFVSVLYVLSPIFQTLTRSISSDSIWALTVCLVLLHLYFHDYSLDTAKGTWPPGSASTLSSNVSLNASIAASVLIASRVSSQQLVFALMLFSMESFLILPLVARSIRQQSPQAYMGFFIILAGLTSRLLFPLNQLAFAVFLLVVLFITFGCPYWLIRIQKFKFEINGPWDEAKLCFDLD